MSLKLGQQLKLLHDGKKYHLVNENTNGGLPKANSFTGQPNNAPQFLQGTATIDTYLSYLGDLDLPEPLSLEQKRALQKLIQERAALMRYCIDTMREEVLEKGGYEMHENSIRSLGVSLFIHINKYVP